MRESRHIEESRGFTLIESAIAMLVFIGAMLSLLALMAWGITLQADSLNAILAHSLAQAQIEELRALPSTDVRLAVGGSLTSNVANHFNQPAGRPVTRRWVVAAGPGGTLSVAVTVVPNNANVAVSPFQFQALLRP